MLVLSIASCEENLSVPLKESNSQVEVELGFYKNATNLKTGEEEDDDPVPDTISGQVTNNSQPLAAGVDLLNSTNNNLVQTTATDTDGYFYFYNLESGTYVVKVVINGEIVETINVTI